MSGPGKCGLAKLTLPAHRSGNVPVPAECPTSSTVQLHCLSKMAKSATEQALATPELLSIILDYCYDYQLPQWGRHFLRLRRVNRLWYAEGCKSAFRLCGIEKMMFLKKLVDAGSKNYGPLVQQVWFDNMLTREFFTLMEKGETLKLENVTELEVCGYSVDQRGYYFAHMFSSCISLRRVSLSDAFNIKDLADNLGRLMEIAPEAQFHIDIFLHDMDHICTHRIFSSINSNADKFTVKCIYDYGKCTGGLGNFCELIHQYPSACKSIKSLDICADNENAICLSDKQLVLFDLVTSSLDSIDLIVESYADDGNGNPLLRSMNRCRNLTRLEIVLGNVPDEKIIDKWAKDIVDCAPKLEFFSIFVGNIIGYPSEHIIIP